MLISALTVRVVALAEAWMTLGNEPRDWSSVKAAEVESVACAQHVHGERQQHARQHRSAENQAPWKKGRFSHISLVG